MTGGAAGHKTRTHSMELRWQPVSTDVVVRELPCTHVEHSMVMSTEVDGGSMLMKQREEPLLQACVAAVPRWAVDGVVAAHDDVARIFCRTQCRFNPLPMHLSPCRWRLARLAAEKRGVDQNEINASVAIVSVVQHFAPRVLQCRIMPTRTW